MAKKHRLGLSQNAKNIVARAATVADRRCGEKFRETPEMESACQSSVNDMAERVFGFDRITGRSLQIAAEFSELNCVISKHPEACRKGAALFNIAFSLIAEDKKIDPIKGIAGGKKKRR